MVCCEACPLIIKKKKIGGLKVKRKNFVNVKWGIDYVVKVGDTELRRFTDYKKAIAFFKKTVIEYNYFEVSLICENEFPF